MEVQEAFAYEDFLEHYAPFKERIMALSKDPEVSSELQELITNLIGKIEGFLECLPLMKDDAHRKIITDKISANVNLLKSAYEKLGQVPDW